MSTIGNEDDKICAIGPRTGFSQDLCWEMGLLVEDQDPLLKILIVCQSCISIELKLSESYNLSLMIYSTTW